jgi:hypothetical protein
MGTGANRVQGSLAFGRPGLNCRHGAEAKQLLKSADQPLDEIEIGR